MKTHSNMTDDVLKLRAQNNLQRLEEDRPDLAKIVRNITEQPTKDAYWAAKNLDQLLGYGTGKCPDQYKDDKRRLWQTAFDVENANDERPTVLAAIKSGLHSI